MSEKSFCGKCGTEIQPSDSFCTKCGEKKHVSESISSSKEIIPEKTVPTSRALWLLPILLGFIGGLIMYFIVKDKDKIKAQNGLVLGVIMTVAPMITYWLWIELWYPTLGDLVPSS